MPCESKLRLISNQLIPAGSLTADSVASSDAIFNTYNGAVSGSGRVDLTGPYTGDADTEIEIEIDAGAGSTPRLSDPVRTGAGDQTLTDLSVDAGNPAQTYTITLDSLGLDTLTARYVMDDGDVLTASVAGDDGNLVMITVDQTPLIEGAALGSLPARWRAGDVAQPGPQWAFGHLPLDPDGALNIDTPYVRIGPQPFLYRPYTRRGDDGATEYALDPAPPLDIPEAAVVIPVTVGVTVTMDDGTTTRVYPNILSRYDLYDALRNDASRIVEPPAIVVDDRTPGGQSALPLNLITNAYIGELNTQGGRAVERNPLVGLAVAATQPTQLLTLECIAANKLNAERWELYGPIYGRRQLKTGDAFSAGGVSLQVPTIALPPSDEPIRFYISAHSLSVAKPRPLVRPAIGVNGRNTSFRLRYEARPIEAACTPTTVIGGPKLECLGTITLTEAEVAAMDADYKSNLGTLLAWHNTAQDANITIDSDADEILLDANDLLLLEELVQTFRDALRQIIDETVAGALRTAALADWNTALSAMQTEVSALSGALNYQVITGATTWGVVASDIYEPGALLRPSEANDNGHVYLMVSGRSYAADTEPTWATGGGTFTSGDATFKDMGLSTIEGDLDAHVSAGEIEAYVARWKRELREALREAEIDPFDGAGTDGSECWRDRQTSHWWVFIDEDRADYMPVQPGYYYHATRRIYDPATERYRIEATQEWGFGLEWCAETPPEAGDEITITLSGLPVGDQYSIGNKHLINVIGAGDIPMLNGRTGDDTQVWRAEGSVDGFIGSYSLDKTLPTPALFSTGGLEFRIILGALAPKVGDAFSFVDERAQFIWRRDTVLQGAAQDVADTVALADGLTAVFTPGRAPNWEPGDIHTFRVEQPNAATNAAAPDYRRYKSGAADWILTRDHGAATLMTVVVIGPHDIPSTATIAFRSGTTSATADYSEAITWREGLIVHYLAVEQTAQFMAIEVTGAAGAQVQWLYAGEDWKPTYNPVELEVFDVADMDGEETRAGTGFGVTADVSFVQSVHEDYVVLRAMHRYAKADTDQPIVLVPNADYGEESALVYMPDQLPRVERRRLQAPQSQRKYNFDLVFDSYVPPPFT